MEKGGSKNHDISVVCGDLDQTMVDLAAQRIKENGWQAKAERLDAQVLRNSLNSLAWRHQTLTMDMDSESSLQRQLLHACPYELWASTDVRPGQSTER